MSDYIDFPEDLHDEKLRVRNINGPPKIFNKHDKDEEPGKRHRHKHQNKGIKDEAADHYDALIKASEMAHEQLSDTDSPYRFNIYKNDGEIFIDIISVDKNGIATTVMKKDISHEEFRKWLDHIREHKGFFFEGTG
ncbi:MAG: hypothetical protein ACLFQK_11215 [Fibrobacterota bacterium]